MCVIWGCKCMGLAMGFVNIGTPILGRVYSEHFLRILHFHIRKKIFTDFFAIRNEGIHGFPN